MATLSLFAKLYLIINLSIQLVIWSLKGLHFLLQFMISMLNNKLLLLIIIAIVRQKHVMDYSCVHT